MAKPTTAESIQTLEWTLNVWLPHELKSTTHARRLASLRRQKAEATAELARLRAEVA